MLSEAQCFPKEFPENINRYEVFLPLWLNKELPFPAGFDYNNDGYSCSWVTDDELEFVRKPTDTEIDKIIARGETEKFWTWGTYKTFLKNC